MLAMRDTSKFFDRLFVRMCRFYRHHHCRGCPIAFNFFTVCGEKGKEPVYQYTENCMEHALLSLSNFSDRDNDKFYHWVNDNPELVEFLLTHDSTDCDIGAEVRDVLNSEAEGG